MREVLQKLSQIVLVLWLLLVYSDEPKPTEFGWTLVPYIQ